MHLHANNNLYLTIKLLRTTLEKLEKEKNSREMKKKKKKKVLRWDLVTKLLRVISVEEKQHFCIHLCHTSYRFEYSHKLNCFKTYCSIYTQCNDIIRVVTSWFAFNNTMEKTRQGNFTLGMFVANYIAESMLILLFTFLLVKLNKCKALLINWLHRLVYMVPTVNKSFKYAVC